MMVERILVVGPKDCLAMVDDLAPKGFEIIKAPSNSPEAISALPGAHYLVGFVQQMVSEQLYKAAPHLRLVQCLSAGYDRADLVAIGPVSGTETRVIFGGASPVRWWSSSH